MKAIRHDLRARLGLPVDDGSSSAVKLVYQFTDYSISKFV